MSTIDDYDFSKGNAGSSLTTNSEAGQVRVGGYICMKEQYPCKVTAVSTSKTGKHGHAKCNFTAVDIFTGKKYEDIIPSTHTALIPVVVSKNYSLVDITEEDYLSLMDEEGNIREDVKLPEWPDNFAREIKALFESGKPQQVTVHNAMGKDQVTAIKEEQEIKA
uniref:Eukaryotic translation initiation factor 5A n=1 Tax=Coccolithus braarudii TaxID=221442 RepID=A0A7S0QA61_9EUKA